jgi:hypothetical protein
VDNFTDGAGDVLWDTKEKMEREAVRQDYERDVEELER